MELRQLSYFATIVNEGNISQAAKKLNISQPPLSHQMKLLESELGVTLFERGSRRIRLTPAGKTFYDRALAILDLSQAARTELTAQKQEIQGVVRLGIISSAVEFVTRHYLAQAEKKGWVINVSQELPKSFIVCEDRRKTVVYISQISPATLRKRTGFMAGLAHP